MIRFVVPERSMRAEAAWVVVGSLVIAVETIHPLVKHMWVLISFINTFYVAHLPASGIGARGGLSRWLWAWRFPVATLVLFGMCAMVDQVFSNESYSLLPCICVALFGSLLIRRAAKRAEVPAA